jgi:hypothetical protein
VAFAFDPVEDRVVIQQFERIAAAKLRVEIGVGCVHFREGVIDGIGHQVAFDRRAVLDGNAGALAERHREKRVVGVGCPDADRDRIDRYMVIPAVAE